MAIMLSALFLGLFLESVWQWRKWQKSQQEADRIKEFILFRNLRFLPTTLEDDASILKKLYYFFQNDNTAAVLTVVTTWLNMSALVFTLPHGPEIHEAQKPLEVYGDMLQVFLLLLCFIIKKIIMFFVHSQITLLDLSWLQDERVTKIQFYVLFWGSCLLCIVAFRLMLKPFTRRQEIGQDPRYFLTLVQALHAFLFVRLLVILFVWLVCFYFQLNSGLASAS